MKGDDAPFPCLYEAFEEQSLQMVRKICIPLLTSEVDQINNNL